MRKMFRLAGGLALVAAAPVSAHMGTGLKGGFLSGFAHPLSGPDHLLAMVSVGLWGAILGRPLIVALPVIFPTVMAMGGLYAIAGGRLPPVEIGIALSVLMLGAAIAFEFRAPVWLASLMVAVFAVFHGYAHGAELPSAADPVGYSIGFMLATGLLHVAGIAIGLIDRFPWGIAVIRTLGAGVVATGIYFMWQALA